MLNYLWAFMIVIGIGYAAITGNLGAISDGALDAAKDAVNLCITMLGVMSVWTGLMRIAEKSGLIGKCNKGIRPLMHWIFPDVPVESKAMQSMTMNVIANFLGLGWAATPAGIKAMENLAELEEERRKTGKHGSDGKHGIDRKHGSDGKLQPQPQLQGIASNAMCAFLVLNISSVQLIPITIIAYRSQYGSANPTAIVLPAIIATTISTLAGLLFCKLMYGKKT